MDELSLLLGQTPLQQPQYRTIKGKKGEQPKKRDDTPTFELGGPVI